MKRTVGQAVGRSGGRAVDLIALILLCVPACRSSAGGPTAADQGQPGRLEVRWFATTVGTPWTGTTMARWCAADSSLLIFAERNDTVVGLALYATDTPRAERYPVLAPAPFSPRRPQATGVARMLTATGLKTLESMTGEVSLTAAEGQWNSGTGSVSGKFDFQVRQSNSADMLHLTGGFNRLEISAAETPCARAEKR